MSGWARQERESLVAALREFGADAPTVPEGWQAKDLAAHVYVRERRPDAAAGVLLPGPFASYTERVMGSALRVYGFDGVVERIEAGPPLVFRPVDDAINLFEFFVHTEDVRRANGLGPRGLPLDLQKALFAGLRRQVRLTWRRAKNMRVELVADHGERLVTGDGPTVTITGPASEIALYAFNRKSVAQVQVSGDGAAAKRLARTRLGL